MKTCWTTTALTVSSDQWSAETSWDPELTWSQSLHTLLHLLFCTFKNSPTVYDNMCDSTPNGWGGGRVCVWASQAWIFHSSMNPSWGCVPVCHRRHMACLTAPYTTFNDRQEVMSALLHIYHLCSVCQLLWPRCWFIVRFPSIHPLSAASPGVGSGGQQLEQRNPDVPVPGHFLQLFRGDPEAFPGQTRVLGLPWGLLPVRVKLNLFICFK